MTAKETLRQIRDGDDYIESLKDQVEEVKTKLTHITPILSDMPAYHGDSDKMINGIAKMIELKEQLEREIDKYYEFRCATVATINQISNMTYRRILSSRYFQKDHNSFEEIATAIGYSYYRTVRMHGVALQEFNRVREGKE